MKRKYQFVLSAVILAILISACSGSSDPAPAETSVRGGSDAASGTSADIVSETEDQVKSVPDKKQYFTHWNDEASAPDRIVTYVEAVTGEGSAYFIPEKNRIALFDLDGTVYCETFPVFADWIMFSSHVLEDDPDNYSEEVRTIAERVAQAEKDRIITGDLGIAKIKAQAEAYKGVSIEDYASEARRFCDTEAQGFTGLLRGDAFYLPMLDIIDYLQDNGFTVCFCTGMNRIAARAIIEGKIDVPPGQVIGTDFTLKSASQPADLEAAYYDYLPGEDLLMDGDIEIEGVMTNKVFLVAQEIGQKPVLSFGGSRDDFPMLRYSMTDNPFRSEAFIVLNDDSEREWGDPEQTADLKAAAQAEGWNTISMRDDWKTIYGPDVRKDDSSDNLDQVSSQNGEEYMKEIREAAAQTAQEPAAQEPAAQEQTGQDYASDIITAYKSVLQRSENDYGAYSYGLYDLNADGIPELIINGGSKAEYNYIIFTYDGSQAVDLNQPVYSELGSTAFYTDPSGALYFGGGRMGENHLSKVNYVNGEILFESIPIGYDGPNKYDVIINELGLISLPFAAVSDYSLVESLLIAPSGQSTAEPDDAYVNGTGGPGGSIPADPAQQAIAAYRQSIADHSWNSANVPAVSFSVVDINQDGIFECVVDGGDHYDVAESLLYYTGNGLQKYEYGGAAVLDAVDQGHSWFHVGRVRGKAYDDVYAFSPETGVTELDSWFWGYDEAESEKKHNYYMPGMKSLVSVSVDAENLDRYLSGSGAFTGFH